MYLLVGLCVFLLILLIIGVLRFNDFTRRALICLLVMLTMITITFYDSTKLPDDWMRFYKDVKYFRYRQSSSILDIELAKEFVKTPHTHIKLVDLDGILQHVPIPSQKEFVEILRPLLEQTNGN